MIKISAVQTMYGENAFKPPALPFCCGTQVKQEDISVIQIQEKGLLGFAITSTMKALLSV